MRRNAKAEVAQDLRAEPVTQADILELNHTVLRSDDGGQMADDG
jgi:hypothetical protein